MRKITVDSRAVRFHYDGGGTNCFWRDILFRRRRIFWRSLRDGLQKWTNSAKEENSNVVN